MAVNINRPHFKVWLQIEKIDYRKDTYENMGEPMELGVFSSLHAAENFSINLHVREYGVCPGPECKKLRGE